MTCDGFMARKTYLLEPHHLRGAHLWLKRCLDRYLTPSLLSTAASDLDGLHQKSENFSKQHRS